MTEYVDATFYAQVEPEWSSYVTSRTGEREVVRAKVVSITQGRPRRQAPNTVLTKLTLRVPKAAFMPLRPEAIVVIPESMTSVAPIEVEAVDLNDDRA